MITTPQDAIDSYYAEGLWDDRKLHELLFETALTKPDEVALVDPANKEDLTGEAPRRLSYQDLVTATDHLACTMLGYGIAKNDILLVQMPNTVELVLLYLAASRMGAIISPIPMQYKEHEMVSIITVLEPKAVVTIGRFKGSDFTTYVAAAIDQVAEQHPEQRQPLLTYWGQQAQYGHSLQKLLAQRDDQDLHRNTLENLNLSANDVFTICWTSGTEGTPKGIPRSHNQWKTVGRATYDGNQIKQGEFLLNPFPFVNMASIGGLFLSWLYSGGKLVLHHPMDLPVFLKQIADEKINYTLAPPALLNSLLKSDELLALSDFSSIRAIGSGSAPLDEWMVAGFKQRFNIEVVNHFGSNEGVCLLCGPEDTDLPAQRARLFPRSHAFLITRLVDPDTKALLTTAGTTAELQIAGPSVFDGYYKAADLSAAAFTEDGYFKTGDLFEIDKEDNNFYRFIGRCKDLIIRGGMNIAPAELDNLLSAHEQVVEAAVAGYPCQIMGERIAAFIVSKSDDPISLEDINNYLKAQKVANFKLPEKVIMVKALPRNPLGKVMRSELTVSL